MIVANRAAVVAVSGVKNSGKTTLIEAMLPYLSAMGLQVAVIKHDGHSFLSDPLDTDTGRFMAAGAVGTAIYDGEKVKVIRQGAVDEGALITRFPEADLVLLEGFKYSAWPKIEVVRGENSTSPVCSRATLLALVTDLPITPPGVPVFSLGDAEGPAKLLLRYVKEGIGHD